MTIRELASKYNLSTQRLYYLQKQLGRPITEDDVAGRKIIPGKTSIAKRIYALMIGEFESYIPLGVAMEIMSIVEVDVTDVEPKFLRRK